MALCREMNHAVDVIFRKDLFDGLAVTDIRLYKGVVVPLLDVL